MTTPNEDRAKEREAIRARVEALYPAGIAFATEFERTLATDLRTLLTHVEEDEREIATLSALNDSLGHPVDSPCGHSSVYAVSEDGGAHIRCLVCRELKLSSELALREQRISGIAEECDRFLENLKGDDRDDGTFVAISLLTRNIRKIVASESVDTMLTKER